MSQVSEGCWSCANYRADYLDPQQIIKYCAASYMCAFNDYYWMAGAENKVYSKCPAYRRGVGTEARWKNGEIVYVPRKIPEYVVLP